MPELCFARRALTISYSPKVFNVNIIIYPKLWFARRALTIIIWSFNNPDKNTVGVKLW